MNNLICIEKFADFPQLGRFTLRTEGDIFILYLLYFIKLSNSRSHSMKQLVATRIVNCEHNQWKLSIFTRIAFLTGKTVAIGKVTELPSSSSSS